MTHPPFKDVDAKPDPPSWKLVTRFVRRSAVDILTFFDPGYRLYLYLRGARPPKSLPAYPWQSATLQNNIEWQQALNVVRESGLLAHISAEKNWDALKAVSCITANLDKEATVLDAGGTLYSAPLIWLYQYGFRNLFSVDLAFKRPRRRGKARYLPGDLTHTTFPAGYFDAVTCMSVLEHGVDFFDFIKEMKRILRVGGYLLFSVDYWCEPTKTEGLYAFGTPIHVFHRSEVEHMITLANEFGFEIIGNKETMLRCGEKSVRWPQADLDLTFLFVALKKERE